MSILLSAIFIFRGLILLLVTEISEQPRYIFANISGLGEYFSKRIFALKHWVQAGRFEYHEPYIQNNYNFSEYRDHGTQNDRLEPSVSTQKSVLKNIHQVLRYWQKCIWVVQRFLLQATKSDHEK